MAIRNITLGVLDGAELVLKGSTISEAFTQEQLREAFDLVAPKPNWKAEIDAVIPREKRDVVAAAIEHFTGSEAEFQCAGDEHLRVTADGYFRAVGA
jgi:hypothetical protein